MVAGVTVFVLCQPTDLPKLAPIVAAPAIDSAASDELARIHAAVGQSSSKIDSNFPNQPQINIAASRGEAIDNDPIVRHFLDRFPDLEPLFKRMSTADLERINLKLTQMVAADSLSMSQYRHISEFIHEQQ